MNNDIMVSIICNAYNHEKYIRDALDSFLMQKTDFAFEVLVHDDASTDKTADIIRQYEQKYPDIIKPIYQTENQYSKDVDITGCYQYPRARGKYIAYCEGDDYWIDSLKLQKQVDAMEQHPELDMCTCGAIRVAAQTKKPIDYVRPAKKDIIFTTRQVILGKGGYFANASTLYRNTLCFNIPKFVANYPLDYLRHIHGSLRGGILYLSDCMVAYRWMSVGSWNSTTYSDIEKVKLHKKCVVMCLDTLDAETDFKYTKTIHRAQMTNLLHPYRVAGTFYQLLQKENSEIFNSLPIVAKLEVVLKSWFPILSSMRKAWDERKLRNNE